MDMVRLGIGLYGVSPCACRKLQQAATLKTTILQIQQVPAGESVGYSRMSRAARDSRIAVIPIGYADGLNRHLGNGLGEVWINSRLCPVAGNICMDTALIDVTDADAREGDTVIVFGEPYPITRLSEKLNTIPYEILTSISPRVKRIYYRS
jgi:alanine racemase